MIKTVLVTGGTSGFGKAAAKLLKKQGNQVIVVSRNQKKINETMDQLHVDGFSADISKKAEWDRLFAYVQEKYGRLDLLVNCAEAAITVAPLFDQTEQQIDQSVQTNLMGVIWGCDTFGPMMAQQRSGTIINVASVCATHAWPGFSVYAAAKAGVRSFSKSLYVELREKGVRVTCLIPGGGDTNFGIAAGTGPDNDALLKANDVGQAILDIWNLPEHVVVEETTVWGIDQQVEPL